MALVDSDAMPPLTLCPSQSINNSMALFIFMVLCLRREITSLAGAGGILRMLFVNISSAVSNAWECFWRWQD